MKGRSVHVRQTLVFGAWSCTNSSSAEVISSDDKVSSLCEKKEKRRRASIWRVADSLGFRLIARPIKMSNVPRKYRSRFLPRERTLWLRSLSFSFSQDSPRMQFAIIRGTINATEFRRRRGRRDPIYIIAGGLSARIIYIASSPQLQSV